MINRLYSSDTLRELFSVLLPSFYCSIEGSSSLKRESFLSNFLLGINLSVTAHFSLSSVSSGQVTSKKGL